MKSFSSKIIKFLGYIVIILGSIFVGSSLMVLTEAITAIKNHEEQSVGALFFASIPCAVIAFFSFVVVVV